MPTIWTDDFDRIPWTIIETHADLDEYRGTTTFGKLVPAIGGNSVVFGFEIDWIEQPQQEFQQDPYQHIDIQDIRILSPTDPVTFRDEPGRDANMWSWQEFIQDPDERKELCHNALDDLEDLADLYNEVPIWHRGSVEQYQTVPIESRKAATWRDKNSIQQQMEQGKLPNPYKIQSDDVGKYIDSDFGRVAWSDVGRKLYLRNGIIQMESMDQATKRKSTTLA